MEIVFEIGILQNGLLIFISVFLLRGPAAVECRRNAIHGEEA